MIFNYGIKTFVGTVVHLQIGHCTPLLSSRSITILSLFDPCLNLESSTLQSIQRQKCPHGHSNFLASL